MRFSNPPPPPNTTLQCHAGNFSEDTKKLVKTWAKLALKENFVDLLMENKDSLKETPSGLDKAFLDTSKSGQGLDTEGMENLVNFFKAQVDNLERELSSKLEQKPEREDCVKVRLLTALFGKDEDVANWIAEDLNIFKIMCPDKEAGIQSALDDLKNIKQMASALSLQSLKVLIRPVLDERFQEHLDAVVRKVIEIKNSGI